MSRWKGVFTFPVSTMDAHGEELDLGAFRSQIDFVLDGGMHGITVLGSIGEFAYLRSDERDAIVRTAVEQVAGRAPVMAGVSAITTADAVRYAKFAEDAGADAVMVVLQSYFALTADEIVAHFAAIADATPLPIFVYNNTGTTNHDVGPALLRRLVELPTVTGIKESSGKLERTMELQRVFGDRLEIFCGWEPLAFSMFELGIESWSCGIGNFVPRACVDMWESVFVKKDLDRAREIHRMVAPLSDFILRHRLAACVKPGLEMMGRRAGGPRRPVTPIDAELKLEMIELLRNAGAVVSS